MIVPSELCTQQLKNALVFKLGSFAYVLVDLECVGTSVVFVLDCANAQVYLYILSSYQGASFYNPYIPTAFELLSKENLIEESEGARVIYVGVITRPLIVVKKDGGYNYASTDLAALWFVFTFWMCLLMGLTFTVYFSFNSIVDQLFYALHVAELF